MAMMRAANGTPMLPLPVRRAWFRDGWPSLRNREQKASDVGLLDMLASRARLLRSTNNHAGTAGSTRISCNGCVQRAPRTFRTAAREDAYGFAPADEPERRRPDEQQPRFRRRVDHAALGTAPYESPTSPHVDQPGAAEDLALIGV
jgi:hypothetical protein